jgi:Fur family ferric uptake transcriptional regulator
VFDIDKEGTLFKYLLAGHRLRATPARLRLLEMLSEEKHPLGAADISAKLADVCGIATTYRALEAMVKAGLVSRVDVGRESAHFEIGTGRRHHHHAVCTSCGDIEDVIACEQAGLHSLAGSGLKKFKRIESHTLEFFGLCVKCTKND